MQWYGMDKSERVDNTSPVHERAVKPPRDDLLYKMPTIKPSLFASLLIVRPNGLAHLRDFAQIYGIYFPSVCHNSKQTFFHDTKPHAPAQLLDGQVFVLRPDMTLELCIYISNLIPVHSMHIVKEIYKSDVFVVDTNDL
jgi:hypothetical protein